MQSPSTRCFSILISFILLGILIQIQPAESLILNGNISLADADGSFIGEDAGDALGTSVAFAGDVNGDGYDDILISTYVDDDAGSDCGQVYLIFGNSTAGIDDMSIANANASFLGGSGYSRLGYSIAGAGDVNGDGFDDFIISSFSGNGITYLFFGRSSGWSMDASVYNANASFLGESTQYYSGEAVSGAGDVNSDGYDDFLIGAPRDVVGGNNAGQTYLILGRPSGWSMNTSLSNANASFIGEEATDHAGNSLAGSGDVNGDGFDDFVIGAPNNDQNTGESGKVYIIYGKASGWSMDLDLSYANASFIGHAWSYQGRDVAGVGDVNGDGYDDILIGSSADGNGRAFLAFGGTNMGHNVSLYNANASFVAVGVGDFLATDISGGSDINGDGYDDIMMSAINNHAGGTKRGRTYVVYGKSSGWSMNQSVSNADVMIDGEVNYDNAGYSIAMGGDVNGDGRPDILISCIRNDEGGNDAGQVYLILNEPNSPPSITTTDDTSADEDEFYSIQYAATDAHTAADDLVWTFQSNGDWLSFNTSNGYLNGTPENDDVGSYWVNITVKDEHDGTDWTNFTLTVNNVNDPPEIVTTDVTSTDEDELYSVMYAGTDIDPTDDVFTWTLDSNADWLTLVNASGYLNGIPDNSDVGDFWVNVTLSDNKGGYDWTNFTLTVNNVNDAPELMGNNILYVDEDSEYYARYDAIDIDPTNDDITWSITTAAWMMTETHPGYLVLSGTPLNDHVDSYDINITIDDGNGAYDWTEFTLQVNNTNDDPVIENDDTITTLEDELYSIHYSATDIDPTMDILSWELDTDADWLEIDDVSGYLNGTPDNDDVGTYWVNITVTDGNGGSDWTEFDLEVVNVNDDPVVTENGITSTNEDELYSLLLTATDIDPTNDTFTWSFVSNADWLSIDEITGYLNGTPGNDDVGTYWVNVSAFDGEGGADWYYFILEVMNVNDDPVIATPTIPTAIEDELYQLFNSGTDIDPTMDTFTWSMNTDAGWLTIDEMTGEINGTPTNDDVGEFWVNISVSDGNGGSDWVNLTIEVMNTNDAPTIVTENILNANEDEEYLVTYMGEDIDPTNDTLTWDLITDADWLSMDPDTGNLTGIPLNEDVGFYDVNISLSDGNGGIVWANFSLEVVNTNDDPIILTNNVLTATEDVLYEVIYEAVDEDPTNDTLTWSLDTDAAWLSFNAETNTLSGTPTNDDIGEFELNLSVSDDNGGFDNTIFTITVANTNDIPTWNDLVGDQVIEDDTVTSIEVGVSDPDADSSITYSISTEPASGIIIDPATGEITWEEGIEGIYLINVSASDGTETIYQEFTLDFPENKDESEFPWLWLIIIIIAIVVIALILFLVLKKKKEEPEETRVPEE